MEAVLDAELLCHCIFYTCFHIYYTDPSFSKIDELNGLLFLKWQIMLLCCFWGFSFLKWKQLHTRVSNTVQKPDLQADLMLCFVTIEYLLCTYISYISRTRLYRLEIRNGIPATLLWEVKLELGCCSSIQWP